MSRNEASARSLVIITAMSFAAFGAFWGAWGASIPRVRDQAGLDDAQLGLALLFVSVGALPAMLVTGKAMDRWGLRVAAGTAACLGVSGVVVALAGQDLVSLSVALTLMGATSGASDVAMNTVAGRAERAASRPVITRAHAVFSAFVVIASLGTGLLLGMGAPLVIPFVVVAVIALVTAALMARILPARRTILGNATVEVRGGTNLKRPAGPGQVVAPRSQEPRMMGLIALGLLGALALASENAHQHWSAVFLTDALGADVALGSLAPAIFAGAVAVTRLAAGGIGTDHARVVLATGSAVAAAGALVLSTASTLALSAVGLITAAVGTAVLFPTILSVVSERVEEAHRGRATSTLTIVAYLGFLLSPVYVGLWSGAVGIRGAMLAVSALGVLLLLLTPMVRPAQSFTSRSHRGNRSHAYNLKDQERESRQEPAAS